MDDLNTEIERRQAIADAATPGPWVVERDDLLGRDSLCVRARTCPAATEFVFAAKSAVGLAQFMGRKPTDADWDIGRPDAAFAAHARTGYPQCLAALKLAVAALGSGRLDKIEAMEALAAIKRALEAK